MSAIPPLSRRSFLRSSALAATSLSLAPSLLRANDQPRPISLFNGHDLSGWRPFPRLPFPKTPEFAALSADELMPALKAWIADHPEFLPLLEHYCQWEVVDGAIVGGKQPPGSDPGAYLISEQAFSDFELELDARPDWPADTGIVVRAHECGFAGFQVLVDHRPNGGIGGIFGNGIGSFLAAPVVIDGDKGPGMTVRNLRQGQRETRYPHPQLSDAASFAEFQKVWQTNDWNHFRIRCVGRLPVITIWINGLKICELDAAKIETPGYDPKTTLHHIGRAGHIAFEVHNVAPKDPLGQDRWARGAVCRWRNVQVRDLSSA